MPNLVKIQFPSGTLSSFDQPVTAATTAGPAETNATLSQLAQTMGAAPVGNMVNASHSVPNPLGNITSFANAIQEITDALQKNPGNGINYLNNLGVKDPVRANQFNEWLGLCALVALRNVYSMNGLQVELVYEPFVDEPFDRAVYFSLANMDYQYSWMAGNKDGIEHNGMFYLRVNGQYVATYNFEVGLCPMQQYQTSEWAYCIPWFDPNRSENVHQCWINPFGLLAGNSYLMDRLAHWLTLNHGAAVVGVFYPAAVMATTHPATCLTPSWQTSQNQLNLAITSYIPESKQALAASAAANFCTGYAAYLDRDGNPCPMPNLLTESLFLADISQGGSCGLGYPVHGKNWNESWKPLVLTSNLNQLDTSMVVPTLPFTEEGCKSLECGYGDGDYELEDVSFCAYGDASRPLQYILAQVTLRFTVTKESFTFVHIYLPEKIRIGLIPYLGVWPNVKLPVGSGWKHYIATQVPSRGSSFMDKTEKRKIWDGAKPAMIELNVYGGTAAQVCEKGANLADPNKADCMWEVIHSTVPFRFATAQYVYSKQGVMVKKPCGAVFVRQNETFEPVAVQDFELAIDFGTTSSVCAVQGPDKMPQLLPFKDYLQNVTVGSLDGEILPVEESRLLGTAPKFDNDVNEKSVLYQKKVMSVAQLFANHTSALLPYVDGRFFLANSAILCRYIDGNNFATRGIYNELKLAERSAADVLDATAGYLAGLYLHALFYVMEQGGRITQLNLSYPDQSFELELRSRWDAASNIVNDCLEGSSLYRLNLCDQLVPRVPGASFVPQTLLKFWTEAEAASNNFNTKGKRVVIDIGGGTADISIPDTDKMTSVQFAGRELMVNSIIESYRHWNGNKGLRDSSFTKMWGAPLGTGTESAKPELIREFNNRCDALVPNAPNLRAAMDDQTLRMLTEVLMNDYELNIKTGYEYSLFRSVITFKFALLLSMVSQFILDNKDQLMQSPIMGANGWQYPIELHFVGTAAKTLEHVFAAPLKDINGKDSDVNPIVKEIANLIQKITEIPFKVTVNVSEDVQEKKEVAFGMLKTVPAAGAGTDMGTPIIPGLEGLHGLGGLGGGLSGSMANNMHGSFSSSAPVDGKIVFMENRINEIMWNYMKDMDFAGRRQLYAQVFNGWPQLDQTMDTEAEWKKVLKSTSQTLAAVPNNLKQYYDVLENAWQLKIVKESIAEIKQKSNGSVPDEINQLIDLCVNFCLSTVKYGGVPNNLDLGAGPNAVYISDIMPNAVAGVHAGITGLSRKNLLTNSLGFITGNNNNMKSLANQKHLEMRQRLLDVYLVVSMMNDALSQLQAQANQAQANQAQAYSKGVIL